MTARKATAKKPTATKAAARKAVPKAAATRKDAGKSVAAKAAPKAAATAPRKPNLILFGIDSLRTDRMSLFGYKRLTTPHIDKFVGRGAAFSHCISPSIPTTPGYASMFTGMDVFGTDVVALRHKGPMGNHVSTLAEVLEKEGYTTVCVGFSGNPAARGFQKYIDFSGWGSWEAGRSPKAENLNAVTIPALRELAASGKPFFLFMRHMDPHSPYLPPPVRAPLLQRQRATPQPLPRSRLCLQSFATTSQAGSRAAPMEYIKAQYDGAIAYMDAAIGNLFTEMERLGLIENSLTLFNSDHGETLDEHDCYFDHHSIYDNVLRVPLAFVMPGRVPAGFRNDGLCYMKDVMPTILDLLGIDSGIRFDGRSLVPLLTGGTRAVESEAYITECTWMRKHGWRTPQWKLIRALEPDFHFAQSELYNVVEDPARTATSPRRARRVREAARAHAGAHRPARAGEGRDPIYTNLGWHGHGDKPFRSSKQAYETLHQLAPGTRSSGALRSCRPSAGRPSCERGRQNPCGWRHRPLDRQQTPGIYRRCPGRTVGVCDWNRRRRCRCGTSRRAGLLRRRDDAAPGAPGCGQRDHRRRRVRQRASPAHDAGPARRCPRPRREADLQRHRPGRGDGGLRPRA